MSGFDDSGNMPSQIRQHVSQASTPILILDGVLLIFLIGTIQLVIGAIYNIYFHPLSKFPGPLLARSTLLWRMFHSMGGRFHRAIEKQHKIYGEVFRVSPNELSFSSVSSWKAIYGHRPTGQPTLVKSKFYEIYGAGYNSLCIGSERNPEKHAQMKKTLTPAFSTKALTEQEDIVTQCIERFITKIGELGNAKSKGLDMTKWYEMVAFDILGEVAFGESFHSIEDGKPHFWSELVEDHLYFVTLADNLRHFPVVVLLAKWLFPFTEAVRTKHTGYTRNQVARRLANKSNRKDFLTNIVGKVESGEIEKEELIAHVSTLVIAGGETVATFLVATTYHLLHEPKTYDKLRAEIRGKFNSYEDINHLSVQSLIYLQAVVSEGLRIYPPGSQGFPRVSTGLMIGDNWVPAGAEVYTSAWTVTHDEKNFHDPFTFKPERWLDPTCTDIKEASQPFSLGARGCLGKNFAHMEINLILAKMMWKYDMEMLDKGLDWEGDSKVHVMWSKPELRMKFYPRAM